MDFGLPTSVDIHGTEYAIRYDYRVILEIIEVFGVEDATDEEKYLAALQIFYVDFDKLTDYAEALRQLFIFINCGEEEKQTKKSPKLIDWIKDYPRIVAPINRIVGRDIRGIAYNKDENTGGFHWWSMIAAYMEIGDCLFAQIVSIRQKKLKGKALDKSEQEFYKKNKEMIDMKTNYTEAENNVLSQWV